MLLEAMIQKLGEEFPSLELSVNKDEHIVSIPAKHKDVGGIDIQDDEYELTVYLGNFTHWHVGCYEKNLNEKEKANFITTEVTDFLKDLFKDEVVMWGSHEKGGGFYHKGEKPNSKSWLGAQHQEFVWSGSLDS